MKALNFQLGALTPNSSKFDVNASGADRDKKVDYLEGLFSNFTESHLAAKSSIFFATSYRELT